MAILIQEPCAAAYRAILATADQLMMSAATLAECRVVADRRRIGAAMRLLVDGLMIAVVPVDGEGARRAAHAYATWGKGVHPAGLNILDCFAYALAAERGAKLLYVGEDFSRTDITPATGGSAGLICGR